MAKERSSRQKQGERPPDGGAEKPVQPSQPASAEAKRSVDRKRKDEKPRAGGTAVPGAKSTLPKPPPTSRDPNQQQIESYNRTMRRRMQQMGAGPYAGQQKMETLQQQRQKRITRRKQRLEERRAELRKALPGGKVRLDRRITYFMIAAIALIVLLIVAFIVLRVTHVL
ncbi:MAG TPA: hypothetical protein VKY19_24950 [Ktedonosporobacter sp.]|jgi:hypothetical protein|nr:hypothetical protein [Ktedonosporobacter sp.]